MLIRRKLPLIILLLLATSLSLLSGIYYSYISDLLVQKNKERMQQVLNLESAYLDTFFQSRKTEVKYLAENQDVYELLNRYSLAPDKQSPEFRIENSKIMESFKQIEKQSVYVRDVFLLSSNGRSLASSNPKALWIDLSYRQYFKDAMKGKTTISKLIANQVDGESILCVATPVYQPPTDNVIGVMVNIIDMKSTSDHMRELVEPSVGDAYLVDLSGMIAFHTNKMLIGTKPVNKEIYRYFANSSTLPDEGSHMFQSTGGTRFVVYKSIAGTQWKLVIEQDMDVIMATAYRALVVMIALASIVLILAAIIAYRYTRSITRPITELSNVMQMTTKGNLGVRVQYVSKNELGSLSANLNTMLDELTGAYEELEVKNEELLATEEELRNNYNELDKIEKEIQYTQTKYVLALEGAKDIVWEWDNCTNHFFASDYWEKATGRKFYCDHINKVAFEELLEEEEQERLLQQFQEYWEGKTESVSCYVPYSNPEGKQMWLYIKASSVRDENGVPIKTAGLLADNTYQKEAEERINHLAFIHQLTKLPNRAAFLLCLQNIIELGSEEAMKMAVLHLDIDNFKRINDSLGHSIGDQLLVEAANRLRNLEGKGDRVFHLSGDEFTFVLTEQAEQAEIASKAQIIINELCNPFMIGNRVINISISMGISIYPNDAQTVEKIIQNADTAMFSAKESGKAQYVFYTNVMSESVLKKMEIEEIVRRAIKDNLLSMHFQPQFCVQDKKLVAVEALMRITLENGKMVSPKDFIPIAEETGLIVELGEWALRYVAGKIREWLDLGYAISHVSVNVSGVQIKQKNFAYLASLIPEEAGIDPERIELEITESILLNLMGGNAEILTQLKSLGYKIALDDFGTGYSSFSYLRTMPLSTVKIDKSFIDDIADSRKDRELVRQMIDMAHDMELSVVAEGVESRSQYDVLKKTNCDSIQGYYFSKPLNTVQIEKLLSEIVNNNP